MIGSLKGRIETIAEDRVILDVNGVGYEVYAHARLLAKLAAGEAAALAIETHLRDDAIRLYGFSDMGERAAFRALQGVQGVGARHALAVLGVMAPSELADAAALDDWASIARAPGVGKKLAQRIAAELKGARLHAAAGAPRLASVAGDREDPQTEQPTARRDVVSALVNLGYGEPEALRAAASARSRFESEPTVAEWVRAALKEVAAA